MSTPGPLPEVDAEAVAAAVAACPSVSRLAGGSAADQVATYLPGRRVLGVRVTDDAVQVHIASLWGVPIPDVAREVRAAAAPLVHGRPVDVSVDDIEDPAQALPSAEPKGELGAGDPPSAVPVAGPGGTGVTTPIPLPGAEHGGPATAGRRSGAAGGGATAPIPMPGPGPAVPPVGPDGAGLTVAPAVPPGGAGPATVPPDQPASGAVAPGGPDDGDPPTAVPSPS